MALRRGHLECGANCWPDAVTSSRKDHRDVDLISDALPFGLVIFPPFTARFPL